MKKLFYAILFISLTSVLCADVLTDSVGRRVNVRVPCERIVSLSPAATEAIFLIGAQSKLAAVSLHCDYPEDAKKLPKAGTFEKPDVEAIISYKPDLVISGGGVQKTAIKKLEEAGIPVLVLYPRSLKEIDSQLSLIGKLTGSSFKALRAGEAINKKLNALKAKSYTKSTRVYVELWNKPAMTAGATSYLTEVLTIAGGDNVYAISDAEYPRPTKEAIIKLRPQAIFLLYDAGKNYMYRPEIKATEAGKNKKVFVISGRELDCIMRPGPRVAEAAEIFYKYLYGEDKKIEE